MLKDGTMYQDLGCNHFDRRSTDQQKNRLVKRLTDLGLWRSSHSPPEPSLWHRLGVCGSSVLVSFVLGRDDNRNDVSG